MVIDAHLHLWNTERLHYAWLQRTELSKLINQLPPVGRDAVLGGTAARFYALGDGR